jgi:hypothetical protein
MSNNSWKASTCFLNEYKENMDPLRTKIDEGI